MRIAVTTILATLLLAGVARAELNVVATLSDLESIAREVGGDRVKVDSIVDGRHDAHAVEILPSYMLKVRRADVFLEFGMDLEIWAPQIIEGARNRDLMIIDCSKGIAILERPSTPVDASMGDIHVQGNPHYWLDPDNGRTIARTIAEAFTAVDPEGASYYESRLADFDRRLQAKIEEWTELMAPYGGVEVVYFHNSWPYFDAAFGLTAAAFVEPKPGVSPSPGHTARVIGLIREKGIRLILMSPYFDKRVPESIARQTEARLVVLASSVGGTKGATDYISLFDDNLASIRRALEATQ